MILALATRYGSKEVALVVFQTVNEGRTIYVPPYLAGLAEWVAITESADEYEKWKNLIIKLLQGRPVDFDLGWSEIGLDGSSPRLRRWFITPLPPDYQAALRPLVVDWTQSLLTT